MNVFSTYRMQELSREETAAADPYDGRGVFLAAPAKTSGQILKELAERLGMTVPAIAWDGIGAWVDPGSTGMSAVIVRDLWDGGRASECG